MKKEKITIDYNIYKNRVKEHAKNAEYRKSYNAEKLMYAMAETLQEERLKIHFTQKILAQKAGLKQQEISRLEKGDANATIKTLFKVAQGMGKKLIIKLS
ncbi:MAG: helix-turn-helix transcriptional regulator [Candidatus Goldiibacteriota bacterium]|jgi:DNA-binding XRE family transcriptional regulator